MAYPGFELQPAVIHENMREKFKFALAYHRSLHPFREGRHSLPAQTGGGRLRKVSGLRTRGFLIWSMAPIMWLFTVTGIARAVRSRSNSRSASAMFMGAPAAPPALCSACANFTPSCKARALLQHPCVHASQGLSAAHLQPRAAFALESRHPAGYQHCISISVVTEGKASKTGWIASQRARNQQQIQSDTSMGITSASLGFPSILRPLRHHLTSTACGRPQQEAVLLAGLDARATQPLRQASGQSTTEAL